MDFYKEKGYNRSGMTKILLVEDDKSLREIYGVRLLAEGYDIVSAGDGEEALAMAIKERPNLIVSDVMMPKISGFDMLDILRSTTETRGIKVIMMTALSSEDQRRRGEMLGADRYLVKSQVGIEDVVRTVHEVLGDGHLTIEERTANKQAPVVTTEEKPQQSSVAQPAVNIPAPQPVSNPAPVQQSAPVQNIQAPVRATAPSLAQPERQRPIPSLAPTPQPVTPQPVSNPAPVQQSAPAAQPVNYAPRVAQTMEPVRNNPIPTPQPVTPQPVSNPAPVQQSAPQQINDFIQPQTTFTTAEDSSLPKPIAPFSTDRPSGSGERIINPINDVNQKTEEEILAIQMNDILSGGTGENPFSNQQNPQPPIGV